MFLNLYYYEQYYTIDIVGVGILRCWKVDIMGVGYVVDDSAAL